MQAPAESISTGAYRKALLQLADQALSDDELLDMLDPTNIQSAYYGKGLIALCFEIKNVTDGIGAVQQTMSNEGPLIPAFSGPHIPAVTFRSPGAPPGAAAVFGCGAPRMEHVASHDAADEDLENFLLRNNLSKRALLNMILKALKH